MLEKFALPVLVTFFTVLITWFFARKKNKAETISVVKTNDSTEIENLLKMVKEWRETATNWKDLADSYQKELIECRKINGTKLEELYKEIREYHQRVGTKSSHWCQSTSSACQLDPTIL